MDELKIYMVPTVMAVGLKGLSQGAPNDKAIIFKRYALDASSSRRVTNVMDSPSRFVIRGVGVTKNRILSNQDVIALTASLKDVKTIMYGPRAIRFTPKQVMGGDVIYIRSVICVGFTNVAGTMRREVLREREYAVKKKGKRSRVEPPERKQREEGGQA